MELMFLILREARSLDLVSWRPKNKIAFFVWLQNLMGVGSQVCVFSSLQFWADQLERSFYGMSISGLYFRFL